MGDQGPRQTLLQEVVESLNWIYGIFWELSLDRRHVIWGDGFYSGSPLDDAVADPTTLLTTSAWQEREERRQLLQDALCSKSGATQQSGCMPLMLPHDYLNATEMFYFITTSSTFPLCTYGTPGKTIVTGGHDWVGDADNVSMLEFDRVDLAKAAGIRTVVLIAVEGGVVELGTTDSFEEDLSIVHYVRDAFAGCKLLELSVAAPILPEAAANHGHYQNCTSDVQHVSYHPGALTSCNESNSTSCRSSGSSCEFLDQLKQHWSNDPQIKNSKVQHATAAAPDTAIDTYCVPSSYYHDSDAEDQDDLVEDAIHYLKHMRKRMKHNDQYYHCASSSCNGHVQQEHMQISSDSLQQKPHAAHRHHSLQISSAADKLINNRDLQDIHIGVDHAADLQESSTDVTTEPLNPFPCNAADHHIRDLHQQQQQLQLQPLQIHKLPEDSIGLLDTSGVTLLHPHAATAGDVPQIEVRMMENKQVMVKLTVKDQPDLFTDLMLALQDLKLQVQQANIRTCGAQIRHIFAAAKVCLEDQTTQDIAEALSNAIIQCCNYSFPPTVPSVIKNM